MKGFFYFLGGVCILTEISLLIRASNGLENFNFTYIVAMIIIGFFGYFCFSRAKRLSYSSSEISDNEKKVPNVIAEIKIASIDQEQKVSIESLTAENAVQIIESRKLLKEPGKFSVKVTHIVPYTGKDGYEVNIVNYAAMTASQVLKAREFYDNGKYVEATNLHLKSFQRLNKDYQPTKDEFVNIDIDWVLSKSSPNSKELMVINCSQVIVANAPNIKFSNDLEEHSSNLKITDTDKLSKNKIPNADQITIETLTIDNIAQLFIPLDFEKQAQVLAIFLQIKHNNLFIDNIFESFSILFNFEFEYNDFEDGYEFFKAALVSHQINRILIVNLLESIKTNLAEFCRLSSILSAVNGDISSRDRYLSLAMESWQKNKNPHKFLYDFILIKTKADLAIYQKNFGEAREMCEIALEHLGLIQNEKIYWLKYQFARTLIKISSFVQINFDVNVLAHQLAKLQSDAEMESRLNRYLIKVFPESDLSVQFAEIVCNISFNISNVQNENANLDIVNDVGIAIDVFNFLFKVEKETVWVLINEWDVFGEDYTLDQFDNLNENSFTWNSFDIENGISRKQVFLVKTKGDINYENIFNAISSQNNNNQPKIDSRIFFLNPLTDTVFMLWDDNIFVGSKAVETIKPIYDKYFALVNKSSRDEFEKNLSKVI